MPLLNSFPPIQFFARHQTWLIGFTYVLFIFPTFSVTGGDEAMLILLPVACYHWWRGKVSHPVPRWMILAFLGFPITAVLSALANGVEAPLTLGVASVTPLNNLWNLREFAWLALPFLLLPALGLANRRHLLLALFFFAGLMALYGLIQFRWGVDWLRPEGQKMVTPFPGQKGITYYCPDASVIHREGGSSRDLLGEQAVKALIARHRELFLSKWQNSLQDTSKS